ncbi:MAG: NADH-quinone oxidoreductase subunit N [Myxococcota bacterium]|nr:NADH-quinone oxidoreductase subunit N [Myxococcota bacterium]
MGAAGTSVTAYYTGLSAIAPEILLALGMVALLMWEAFAKQNGLGRKAGYATIGLFSAALVMGLVMPSEKQTLFSGMIVIDPFFQFFRTFSLGAGILGVTVALASSEVESDRTGEYYALSIALVIGMIFMSCASDLLMLYLAIELVSLMSYVLAGFRPKNRRSAEAALKYVIYGGAASGIMLVGFSILFGITGTTQLSLINTSIMELTSATAISGLSADSAAAIPVGLTAGLVLSFCGFAYKIAAAPLHMWSPDVYEGAPTPFTAFLSTGPKAAGFAALIRFFFVGFANPEHYATNELLADVTQLPWPHLIVIVSMITMTIGNFAALGQTNAKRFLAYSSIAHAGYSLIGLAAFSKFGASSVLLYMAFYLLMNMGAFYVVIWVKERTGTELIEGFKGLGHKAGEVAATMAICLFALTGLPPLAGFVGKYYLFAAALDRGRAYPAIEQCAPAVRDTLGAADQIACFFNEGTMFYWLAVVAALNSAVSLYYYARIVRKMFLEKPDTKSEVDYTVSASDRAVLLPIGTLLIAGGIFWTPIWNATVQAVDFHRPTIAEIRYESAEQKDASASKQKAGTNDSHAVVKGSK